MGLTKQYLRYAPHSKFNIIASINCNIEFVTLQGQEGRYVAVGACEDIIIWDLRLGEKALVLSGEKHEATHLSFSPNKTTLAAGYEDGTIKMFNLKTSEHTTTFSGHRSGITCLAYDEEGHRLASGSKDTEIIVWDLVDESGLHRLSGHKGVVTQVRFLNEANILVSSSKDTLVKFWDLDTAHCFETLVGHRAEVWGFTLMKDDKYLVTGCNDNELRVWKLSSQNTEELLQNLEIKTELTSDEQEESYKGPIKCEKVGSVLRASHGRVISITCDKSGQVLACHGPGNNVELFVLYSEGDMNERFKKRLRKSRKKAQKSGQPVVQPEEQTQPALMDEVGRLTPLKASAKVKSVSVVMGRNKEIRIAVCLNNNSVELYTVGGLSMDSESSCLRTISTQGHRSEVRSVSFSSDSLAIVSASGESLKMWNRASQSCLRTVPVAYPLCVTFVPGDRHVLAGLRDGRLLIVDIAAGDVLEEIAAHSKELWSVCVTPDQRGCVTGGGDATVKFWDFELVAETESKRKVLSVLHRRTLKLEESILAMKISPNNNLLAVSLLDCTVKIFFVDTLKFFLSLYGHKLPVLCMDISHDSTLIVTGSADRNMKIWGLDFGDCHRSIFAHDDSIMALQFVPKTHYVFTCGKDGRVKQWDTDSRCQILSLQGHRGEAWALSVSASGQHVVSSGSDRVLRLLERTQEPLIPLDEQEEERAALEQEQALATGEGSVVPGLGAVSLPSRKTVGTEAVAEQLLECLELGREYTHQLESVGPGQPAPPVPALMAACGAASPAAWLLATLRRARAADLPEALLLLPFSAATEALRQLATLLAQGGGGATELLVRSAIFLLRMHHGPIVATGSLLPVVRDLEALVLAQVVDLRDTAGYNLHGLRFLQQQLEARDGVQLFREATCDRRDKERRRRKRERTARRIVL